MYEPVADGTTESAEGSWSKLGSLCQRLFSLAASSQRKRLLRLQETLSLGEKRFLAVVEYDGRKFLIGGTPQNLTLLDRLDGETTVKNTASSSGSRPE